MTQEVISRELGIYLLRTKKLFPRNQEVISREPGSHFLETGKSFLSNPCPMSFPSFVVSQSVSQLQNLSNIDIDLSESEVFSF